MQILNIKSEKIIKPLTDYLIDEQIKDPNLNKNQAIELLNKKMEEFSLSNNYIKKYKINQNNIKK